MCRGHNAGDIYLIKTEHLENVNSYYKKPWIKHHGGIPVDKCIGKEVEYLINNSVQTYGCCCGHEEGNPTCLVDIKSKHILEELDYEIHEFSEGHSVDGIYEINLKSR